MKLIKDKIHINRLKEFAKKTFADLVKAVVDVKKEVMVIDGELQSDEEAMLIESGSNQQDLWGINLYPEIEGNDWIEFDSLINIRPSQENRSRGVEDAMIRAKIVEIVNGLVEK